MELNGYRLLLPEGTLDYFDLVDVKESVNEVVFYHEEKNKLGIEELPDRKSTRLNSSHTLASRMPSSA